MKQGRANRNVSESYHRDPKSYAVNPAYTNMLGNMVGDHVTGERGTGTGYRGDSMYRDRKRGYEAPRNVSQSSSNRGSQGRH